MVYLSSHKDGRVLLRLYVQPKASKNKFVGMHGDAIKLCITAPPVDGKANKAVIKFLASFFSLKIKDVCIKNGLQSRTKTVLITGMDLEEIQRRIDGVC